MLAGNFSISLLRCDREFQEVLVTVRSIQMPFFFTRSYEAMCNIIVPLQLSATATM